MLSWMLGRAALCCAWFAVGCASAGAGEPHAQSVASGARGGGEATEAGRVVVLRDPPEASSGAMACSGAVEGACDPPFHPHGCDDAGDCTTEDALRITLAWKTEADLNLHVIDPTDEVISHARVRSGTGGHLDRASRGGCEGNGPLPPEDSSAEPASSGDVHVERVRWTRNPPQGPYRVEVYYWGECHRRVGATVAQVSIAVDGRVHRFERTMFPGERVVVAQFRLD